MDTLILTNAKFYTFNPALPIAERLAVQGGKIFAAGSAQAISADTFSGAKIIDLGGKTVLPAFTDAHITRALAAAKNPQLKMKLENMREKGG